MDATYKVYPAVVKMFITPEALRVALFLPEDCHVLNIQPDGQAVAIKLLIEGDGVEGLKEAGKLPTVKPIYQEQADKFSFDHWEVI